MEQRVIAATYWCNLDGSHPVDAGGFLWLIIRPTYHYTPIPSLAVIHQAYYWSQITAAAPYPTNYTILYHLILLPIKPPNSIESVSLVDGRC